MSLPSGLPQCPGPGPTEPAQRLPPAATAMGMVGVSPAMVQLRRQIAKVARSEAPVLIWGESGSGKELAAQAIHQASRRAAGPLVALNCGAMPASLIQSELFGHERGAYTGAHRERRGLIESASGGTLFLDEIGDLPLDLQANLLRFLQERRIQRIGAVRDIEVDVRVVAASHLRLQDEVDAGRFRADLLYRLHVLPLTVPALRDRRQDLDLLSDHFFRLYAPGGPSRLQGFSESARRALHAHDWPGNVRELINRIQRARVMADGQWITPADLDLAEPSVPDLSQRLDQVRWQAEAEALRRSLERQRHNITRSARELGVSRMTLYRLMHKHGLSSDPVDGPSL